MKKYKTVSFSACAEFLEKRSKFFGFIAPVSNAMEVDAFLENLKQKHREARHHVFAYTLFENGLSRYSDDGEPQGTAGLPILNVLRGNQLFDCAVVVARYFGGVLLGTGGLTRAYSTVAKLVLNASQILTMYYCYDLFLICTFGDYGFVSALIFKFDGNIDSTAFEKSVKIKFYLKESDFEKFCNSLLDATKGCLRPKILGKRFRTLEKQG